jgi:ribose 5-phosphate isomerase B
MNYITDSEIQEIVQRVLSRLDSSSDISDKQAPLQHPPGVEKTIAIGTDHGGFSLKEILKNYLHELGYPIIDCGTTNKESVDYPDFALAVAKHVSKSTAWRGIMIDGAGIGSCIVANKVPGVRAAMCYDYATAANSREHNNANLLTLGAGLIGINQAKLVVKTWLETKFGGGRHARRVNKITSIEKQFMK